MTQPAIPPQVSPDYRQAAQAWGYRTIELLDSYASPERIYETAYAAVHCASAVLKKIEWPIETCKVCGSGMVCEEADGSVSCDGCGRLFNFLKATKAVR